MGTPYRGGTSVDTSRDARVLECKICPNCHTKVLSLITDNATNKRYCYHCIPNPESCVGAVYVSRKMDELNSAGKLDTYPLEQRMKDMNDPPRCSMCGAVSDEEPCSKCEGEALELNPVSGSMFAIGWSDGMSPPLEEVQMMIVLNVLCHLFRTTVRLPFLRPRFELHTHLLGSVVPTGSARHP